MLFRSHTDIKVPNRFGIQSKWWLQDSLGLRLNYVLWIQDILQSTSSLSGVGPVHGLDMCVYSTHPWFKVVSVGQSGTGASAIYPLLSCKLNPDWTFTATGIPGPSASRGWCPLECRCRQVLLEKRANKRRKKRASRTDPSF